MVGLGAQYFSVEGGGLRGLSLAVQGCGPLEGEFHILAHGKASPPAVYWAGDHTEVE
jgi:hypothetical protein